MDDGVGGLLIYRLTSTVYEIITRTFRQSRRGGVLALVVTGLSGPALQRCL